MPARPDKKQKSSYLPALAAGGGALALAALLARRKPEIPAIPTLTPPAEATKVPDVPAEVTKPQTQAVPVEVAKPAEDAKPTEVVKPQVPTKPVEVAKPTKPMEVVKPPAPVKPVETPISPAAPAAVPSPKPAAPAPAAKPELKFDAKGDTSWRALLKNLQPSAEADEAFKEVKDPRARAYFYGLAKQNTGGDASRLPEKIETVRQFITRSGDLPNMKPEQWDAWLTPDKDSPAAALARTGISSGMTSAAVRELPTEMQSLVRNFSPSAAAIPGDGVVGDKGMRDLFVRRGAPSTRQAYNLEDHTTALTKLLRKANVAPKTIADDPVLFKQFIDHAKRTGDIDNFAGETMFGGRYIGNPDAEKEQEKLRDLMRNIVASSGASDMSKLASNSVLSADANPAAERWARLGYASMENPTATAHAYAESGHDLTNRTLFGKKLGEIIPVVRKSWLGRKLDWADSDVDDHYGDFTKSVHEAYIRRAGELANAAMQDDPRTPGRLKALGLDAQKDTIVNELKANIPAKAWGNATTTRQELGKLWAEYAQQDKAPTLDKWDAWMKVNKPEAWSNKHAIDVYNGRIGAPRAVRVYSDLVDPVLKPLRATYQTVEAHPYATAAGTGAALVGAYALHRHLNKKRKKTDDEE